MTDKYKVHVCNKCGLFATYNSEKKIYLCNLCGNINNFVMVRIPYACKLLFQELQTMSIYPRIRLE